MQFTVRGVPPDVEQAARERAGREGVSVNNVLLGALRRGLGVAKQTEKQRDLSDLSGKRLITPEAEAAFEAQRTIDPNL
ncbi:MAG: hypothetical protein ACRCT8_00610 [Lacipirellulaceae bacterium]